MAINKHKNILDYTLQSLLRRKFKNTGIILVFTFIIFAVSSIILLSYSLKKEAGMLLKYSPEIIVQKILAGRHELISTKIKNEIMGIPGVSKVEPRYWGYYYDSGVRANYTIIGIGVSGIENNRLIKGRMPSANEKNAAAIGREIADARIIKKDIGDSLNLQNSGSSRLSVGQFISP